MTEIITHWQIIHTETRVVLRKRTAYNSLWFWDRIQVRRIDLNLINKNKITCQQMDFSLSTDYREIMMKCEKLKRYLDYIRQVKQLWNIKVRISSVVGELGIVN